jgi:hypothetical protein
VLTPFQPEGSGPAVSGTWLAAARCRRSHACAAGAAALGCHRGGGRPAPDAGVLQLGTADAPRRRPSCRISIRGAGQGQRPDHRSRW